MITKFAHNGTTTTAFVDPEINNTPAALAFGTLNGVGESRCRDGDVFNRTIGENIALGRALQDLGRKVEELWLTGTMTVEEREKFLTYVILEEIEDHIGAPTFDNEDDLIDYLEGLAGA